MKIAIVGAGIMGLAVAWVLAKRRHDVSVFEQGPVPNPAGASVDRHRLIRHAYGADDGYCRMVTDAFSAWERVWGDLGERLYIETGTLALAGAGEDWADRSQASLARCGIAHEVMPAAAAARRFPAIAADAIAEAFYLPSGGMLLAERIVGALAKHLPGQGVAIRDRTRVESINSANGTVALASGATFVADLIVAAAGTWTALLLPSLAGMSRPSRQVVVYVEPPDDLLAAWMSGPMVLDIGASSGFYAVPPRQGLGLKIGDHRFSLAGDPNGDRIPTEAEIKTVLDQCRRRLRDFARYRVVAAKVCFYDLAPAERFVIEPVGSRVWAMTGFSGHGFKFAPILAERLADAIDGVMTPAALGLWAAGLAA